DLCNNFIIQKASIGKSISNLTHTLHLHLHTPITNQDLAHYKFVDELALITFPLGNDDLPFDIESDLKKIEYLLNHDLIKEMGSIFKNSINQSNLADLSDNLADTMLEMFTEEHALDYSSPPLYDEYDDDLFEVDDFLPSFEYDSFLYKDFSKVDALPSTNNKDKVFNPGILIRENFFEVITRVAPDKNVKKLAISHASLTLKDFDPPLYELPFFKEVPGAKTLLLFSFENEEKVFKPEILTSKGVHSSLILKLSHRGYKIFKIIKVLKSPMEIFLFSHREDICILDVPCPHFYPPSTNQFGGRVKLSDPKQAFRGRHLMLILVLVMNKCVVVWKLALPFLVFCGFVCPEIPEF
nr:hypothetical protein [Tanacetum cinerariifolium]